ICSKDGGQMESLVKLKSQSCAITQERATPIALGQPRLPLPRLLPALISGGLLWLCYFPMAWNWLAWVSLAPLLCLVRAEGRARNIYWSAWAGGLLFFVPALYWMSVADVWMVFAWLLLAIYCALYVPLAIFFVRRLDRGTRLPLVLSVPLVWISLEYVRS